ncbi:zinc ribbon domain-containing protein [Chlamydiota bacterium]
MSVIELRNSLSKQFVCKHCKNKGAYTNIITVSGDWKNNISKFQNFDFILVSCKQCGCSDFYDMYFTKK